MLTDDRHLTDPGRALQLGVGLASPLWSTFFLAAGAGMAYWAWSQWARGLEFKGAGEARPARAPVATEEAPLVVVTANDDPPAPEPQPEAAPQIAPVLAAQPAVRLAESLAVQAAPEVQPKAPAVPAPKPVRKAKAKAKAKAAPRSAPPAPEAEPIKTRPPRVTGAGARKGRSADARSARPSIRRKANPPA